MDESANGCGILGGVVEDDIFSNSSLAPQGRLHGYAHKVRRIKIEGLSNPAKRREVKEMAGLRLERAACAAS